MQVEQKQKIFIDEFKLLENDHGGEHGFLATSGHFWMHQVTSGCFFLNAFWLFSPPAVFGHFWLAALAGFDYFWLLLHALVLFVHLVRPIIFYIAQIGKHSENWPEKMAKICQKCPKMVKRCKMAQIFMVRLSRTCSRLFATRASQGPTWQTIR